VAVGAASTVSMLPECAAERAYELCRGHRLGNAGTTLPGRRKSGRAQAGSENDRHAAPGKDICNRENHVATEIHVENRNIDAFMVLSQVDSSPNIASRTDDFTAKLDQHVLEQKAYHHLVLHQEDTQALEFFDRRHLDASWFAPARPYTNASTVLAFFYPGDRMAAICRFEAPERRKRCRNCEGVTFRGVR
jgi:hypothetical protein